MTDAVATIRIESGKANAITPAFLDALDARIDAFARGPARAAVVTGYDRFFSAGLALPVLVDLDRAAMQSHIEQFSRVMLRLFACDKPVVAAINGHAIAGGCVLALMCDWRVSADDDAIRIGLNETQLGIGLPAAVLEPLRAQVPASSLVPIALEGALSSPRRAHELGLVHELAPAGALEARARAKAQALAEIPALAAAQVKRGLRGPILEQIERSAAVETERWLDTWFSPEGQARLRAAVARIAR